MGLFSSRGRGSKIPEDPKREAKSKTSAGSGDSHSEDRNQSCKSTPLAQSSQSNSTQDQRSRQRESASSQQADAQGGKSMATIGQSIVFKGELTGDEDLEIDGAVEGNVDLKNHQLTIGANGSLKAEVTAKSIIVIGQVKGNLTATERIEVQATGVVEGDLSTPRLNVQEGAVLNGTIDMSPSNSSEVRKPAPQPSATGQSRAPGASAGMSSNAGEALRSA